MKTTTYVSQIDGNWLLGEDLAIRQTFFPWMTAPYSPIITMYFMPPRFNLVGARDPGSSKSFMIAAISPGLNCRKESIGSYILNKIK